MHYLFGTLACRHCAALTGWPRWAKVEPGRYTPLCWSCYERLDQTFTAARAIHQAQRLCRSAVAR